MKLWQQLRQLCGSLWDEIIHCKWKEKKKRLCAISRRDISIQQIFPEIVSCAWCLFLFIVYTLSGLGLSLKNTVHYFQSGSDSTEFAAQPSVFQPLFVMKTQTEASLQRLWCCLQIIGYSLICSNKVVRAVDAYKNFSVLLVLEK